jgi:hypothetical protein
MRSQAEKVIITLIGAVVLVIITFVIRDIYLRSNESIQCADGPRNKIDIRDFSTTYWTYAVNFEASLADKAKFSGKLDPTQLQQLSEATQQAQEFRKFLVAGYNVCAISKGQFESFGQSFYALDSLSRQIDSLASRPSLSGSDKIALNRLIREYGDLVNRLGKGSKP